MNLSSQRPFQTYSSASIDTSIVESQLDKTQRLIKDVRSLRKKKGEISSSLQKKFFITNFHVNSLRSSVRNNKKYSKMFERSDTSYFGNTTATNKSSFNPVLPTLNFQNLSNVSEIKYNDPSKDITTTKRTKKSTSRNVTNRLPKTFITSYNDFTNNYAYNINWSSRNESLTMFNEKTKKIRIVKYENWVKNDKLYKIIQDRENEGKKVELDIYNYSRSYELLKQFSENVDAYTHYLDKVVEKETEVTVQLKEKRIQLITEINKIKRSIYKAQVRCQKNFDNKFFMLCVKNNTNQVEKFKEEDRIEYYKDNERIRNMLRVNVVKLDTDLRKKKKNSNKMIFRKRISQILESDMVLEYQNESAPLKEYKIFKSTEEFETYLNNISIRVSKLLNQYNSIQEELRGLRDKRDEKKREIFIEIDKVRINEMEIGIMQTKLDVVMKKASDLEDQIRAIPKKATECKKVDEKIKSIHKKMSNDIDMPETNDPKAIHDKYKDYPIRKLGDIERTINYILSKDKEYKSKYPQEYKKARKIVEIEIKHKQNELQKQKETQRLEIINKRVIEKNKKLIILPHRKVQQKFSKQYFESMKKKKKVEVTEDDKIQQKDEEFFGYLG